MRRNIPGFHLVAVCALCLLPTLACADLVKCSDAGGAITYMNGPCSENMNPVEIVQGKEAINHPVKTVRSSVMSTRWAGPIVHRSNKPDVESIRSARIALKLMDEERRQRRFQQALSD